MKIKKLENKHRVTPLSKKKIDITNSSPGINKQQFHVEANIDKEIECAFESLGSSEGRHSSDED